MNTQLFSKTSLVLAFTIFSVFSGCKKDNTEKPKGIYSKGVFIINEGNMSVSSSVSCLNTDSLKVYNDIFNLANNRPLGSYAQSIGAVNNQYYIVIGGSNKIEVVNQTDFKSITDISGFSTPRYFQAINSQKAYVSQWGDNGLDGTIAVIDLATNTIKTTIHNVGSGTEKMLLLNNYVYAVNAGGWGNDSTIAVISPANDSITEHIPVGYNPNSIVADKNNKLWVLCSGKIVNWSVVGAGALVRINPATNKVEQTFLFPNLMSPSSLTINTAKDMLIYTYNRAVYQQDIAASALETIPKINRPFYHIAVDPSSNILYATDPKDFSVLGWVFRYDKAFAKVDSFKVAVGAGEIFFK